MTLTLRVRGSVRGRREFTTKDAKGTKGRGDCFVVGAPRALDVSALERDWTCVGVGYSCGAKPQACAEGWGEMGFGGLIRTWEVTCWFPRSLPRACRLRSGG